jgi:hypothetical protein
LRGRSGNDDAEFTKRIISLQEREIARKVGEDLDGPGDGGEDLD